MLKGYIVFYTTSAAFLSEKLLIKNEQISIKLTPTPREFSSDCGISIYFETENTDYIKNVLNQNKIEFEIKLTK